MTGAPDRSPPPPAGSYRPAAHAGGLVFLAGQTPRDQAGVRHGDQPFDAIYCEYVADPLPARTLVQSGLIGFDIEVDAILDAGGCARR